MYQRLRWGIACLLLTLGLAVAVSAEIYCSPGRCTSAGTAGGADPGATCEIGMIWVDTDTDTDVNCDTTTNNALCICTSKNVWTEFANGGTADPNGVIQEDVEDWIGLGMIVGGSVQSGIAVTYDDANGELDFALDMPVDLDTSATGDDFNLNRDVSTATVPLMSIKIDDVDDPKSVLAITTDADATADSPAVSITTTSAAHDEAALEITQADPNNLGLKVTGESTLVGSATVTGTVFASVGFDCVGDVDCEYGSADIDFHKFYTDGTGDDEIRLPGGSIGSSEILNGAVTEEDLNEASGDPTDGDVLTYNAAGTNTNWEAQSTLVAGTAAALVDDPNDCSAGTFATTIVAPGDLTCAAPTWSDVDSKPVDCRTKHISNPVAADPPYTTWLYGSSFTITHIICVVDPADTGDSVTLTFKEADSNGDPNVTIQVGLACTNTQLKDPNQAYTTIAAERYISMDTTATGGTPTMLTVSICGNL